MLLLLCPKIFPVVLLKVIRSQLRIYMSIIDQHYALIITLLFDTQAPTCFGIHVPSPGSFLCLYELL
jgi:hypothetical protein